MGIRSSRSLNQEITSSSEQNCHSKAPHISPVLAAKNKGPLYDSHLAHTAYMNNVARARRSTGTPHSSQRLKPQHLLRRKLPNPTVQHKKNTSPVPCILKSKNMTAAECISYENVDLLDIDYQTPNDENCNFVDENITERRMNANLHQSQTIYDNNNNTISGCNTEMINKARTLTHKTLSHEFGTPLEAHQKYNDQDLNQQLESILPLPSKIEAISCNNNDVICNNGELRSVYRNNATQTSLSPSRFSNYSSNSWDDLEIMKSVKFPRETAIFYMMHSEEVSQKFSAKNRHDFCRNYSTPEKVSQPSSAARESCRFQKQTQRKYITLESEKELYHPSERCIYISEVRYQEAEKPLTDGVIKKEFAEKMKNGRKLNIRDDIDASVDKGTCCSPEKRKYPLEKTSSSNKNNFQRNPENHDREVRHSENGNFELPEDKQVTKILSRQEMVSSDHSGFLSWNSRENQSKEMRNNMRGKSEDGKSSRMPTPRRFSELNIPHDQVLYEQQLRHYSGPRRTKPTNVGPNAALAKFHAHGDSFVRPRQYLAQTFCYKHKKELELTGILFSNRKGTISRHRSRHDNSLIEPHCPPSTPCSGVYSTEEMKSKMVNAELNEDSPLLMGCVVRNCRKPTSLPSAKSQEEAVGEPHLNRTTIPEEAKYIYGDFNKYTDLKYAPLLRTNVGFIDDESSIRDVVNEEVNKLQSDVSCSDDEGKKLATQVHRTSSAGMESTSVKTPANNTSAPATTRTSSKEGRVRTDTLAFKEESVGAKIMQKCVENKDQICSHKNRNQRQNNYRHLLMNGSQQKCKAHEVMQSSLNKHQTLGNQNIIKLIPGAQEVLTQYETETRNRKQDRKTNTCLNKNSETLFLTEIRSDFTYSNDELKENTANDHTVNSDDIECSLKQKPLDNRSGPNSPRTLTKDARIQTGALAFNASESGKSANIKLTQKSAENKNRKCYHSSGTLGENDLRHLLMSESQSKCNKHEANQKYLHKHQTSENQNKMKLTPDTQKAVSHCGAEKPRKKQDEIANNCNQFANIDKPFLTQVQRQSTTYNVALTESTLKDKDSTVLEYSEQLPCLEKPLRKNSHYNINFHPRNLQHEVDHHQLSVEAPRREIPVYHYQMIREKAATRDPSSFCEPSPQSTETVMDIHSSFRLSKHDVSKDIRPAHDSQRKNSVQQEPEKDDEEQILPPHISRIRYCPIHRQHFELPQEEDDIPYSHFVDSDEGYDSKQNQFQPQQHYCRIHNRMFTVNMIPHEHLPQNIRAMPERNQNSYPGMTSHMDENQPPTTKRDLSSMAPRCRSLVAMFERQKQVVLSGRNWKVEEENISAAMNGVNGMNGHHGELNGGGELINSQNAKGCWTIGLINSKFRYLTAETFGFKINANGASLKKKQVWTLEPASGDSAILLRSHLDKYLAVDTFGNVTCETEERDDPGTKFQISVADDGTGRWALRNITRGYFLGASSDKLTCTAKVPGDAELWHVHLAARPQVNLRSVGRKRFAHLSENLDEIHVDANIPWGEDTLFTLEFRADDNGKYALHTCNNKYLSREGKLVDTCTPNCLFSAEYHAGQLALRDRSGAYLSPIGSKAVLKSRSTTVTKDELFSLEDSLPQASFVAGLNSRYVSVKQGVDVTANQDEISDHETFQLEFDSSTKRWYIRTMQDRYWTLETGGGIQASGDKRSSNALFDLVWQGDGSVAFRANNGKFVSTKRSGHLYANCDNVEDNSKYFFYLINRPILVLKCEQGFVGYKSASSPKLECNKATYETIQVERSEKGVVFFKGQNGKYWHVDGESVTADSDVPEGFFIELRDPTHICIKSTSGDYLVASKNGAFRLGDSDYENATKWEY